MKSGKNIGRENIIAGTPSGKNSSNGQSKDTLADLLGANIYADPSTENAGRSVFGFFEKGILRLEPGNNPANKVRNLDNLLNIYIY